jgi:hypothetical protein
MVTNFRESKTTLELGTNAGTRITKKIADEPGYGTVWYDKTTIANIFGLSELKKKHRVTGHLHSNSNVIPKDYTLTKCQMNTSKTKSLDQDGQGE